MQKTETAKEKADRLLEKSRVLQAEKEKEVGFFLNVVYYDYNYNDLQMCI